MSSLPILGKFKQAPEDRKRYSFDYSKWLDAGETVVSATYEVGGQTSTTPLTVEDLTNDNTIATWFVAGGEHDGNYLVIVEATTSGGQRIRQAMSMRVIDYTP